MRKLYSATREKPAVTVGIGKGAGNVEGVSVHLDSSDPKTLKRFYCPGCGSVAFEYFGSLRVIIAGRGDTEVSLPVVVQCKTNYCKMLFYLEN